MHPQLTAAFGRLDSTYRDLQAAVAAIPAPLHAQKPAADRWSVNEVLEHLGIVEQFFLGPLADKVAAATPGLSPEVDTPAGLADETRAFMSNRENKRNAPETVQPKGAMDSATALRVLADGHARFRGVVSAADGLALSSITHDHRFFGTLNVYQWIELVAGHEGRHLEQIREIAAQVTTA
jgi:hypothetical protein